MDDTPKLQPGRRDMTHDGCTQHPPKFAVPACITSRTRARIAEMEAEQ
jgi:hypothetical protein